MELNVDFDFFELDSTTIYFSNLVEATLWQVNICKPELDILIIDDGQYHIAYDNSSAYSMLLQYIANNRLEFGKSLMKYQNHFGRQHELFKQLFHAASDKFGFDKYSYLDACEDHRFINGRTIPGSENDRYAYQFERLTRSDYNTYSSERPHKVDSIRTLYEFLLSIHPKNIAETRRKKKQLEEEERRERLRKLEETRSQRMQECKDELIARYGTLPELKTKLLSSLGRASFRELWELFNSYQSSERLLTEQERQSDFPENESPYKEYIDAHRLGKVLISDRMNHLNYNKAKIHPIPKESLDEAMMLYYGTKSVDDAYAAHFNEMYSQSKESGDKGEKKVEYALKWLDSAYVRLEKRSRDRIGAPCIYLLNSDFIDEKQEYDHLIVSNKGVFNIETKNLAGKLVIDRFGNWVRKQNDKEEGMKNPLQQIRQHEKVLASFLPKGCNIISILCIANDRAILEGTENFPIPIIKSDLLVEYIENYKSSAPEMTDTHKEECITAIYDHMLKGSDS